MRALLIPVAALLAGGLAAQSTFVIPSGYDLKRGTTYNYYPFHGTTATPNYMPYHAQLIYDTSLFPMPVTQLKGMAFRRPRQLGNNNPAATIDMVIDLSVGPNNAASASSTFANNLGANPVTVYKAQLNLPAEPGGGTGLAPFSIVLPFSQPYLFAVAMGLGLVVDITADNYTATTSWYMDAVGIDAGAWAYALSSFPNSQCVYSNLKVSGGGGSLSSSLYPGGSFYFSQTGMPPNLAGFVMLGMQGPGSQWAGVTLPFSLGFLGAGTCQLGVSMDIILPSSTDAAGAWRWPTINIPNDPAVAGYDVFEQAIYLDPGANAAGLVTTFVMKWPIGSGAKPGGSIVYKYRDTNPPAATGSLLRDRVYVTEFTY